VLSLVVSPAFEEFTPAPSPLLPVIFHWFFWVPCLTRYVHEGLILQINVFLGTLFCPSRSRQSQVTVLLLGPPSELRFPRCLSLRPSVNAFVTRWKRRLFSSLGALSGFFHGEVIRCPLPCGRPLDSARCVLAFPPSFP